MKNLKKNLIVAALSLVALQGIASAQSADTGFYAGGSVGMTKLEPKTKGVRIEGRQDTSDTGFKILGGYQFNQNWAVEAQLQDLGNWRYSDYYYDARAKVTGMTVAAVGLLPVGNGFTVIGKLGLAHQTFKARAIDTYDRDTISRKISATTPLLGIGVEYALTPAMSVRTEYESFGVPTLVTRGLNKKISGQTSMLSVGLRYKF